MILTSRSSVRSDAAGISELIKKGLSKRIGANNDQLEFALKLRTTFDDMDLDSSGTLTDAEIHQALKMLGMDLELAEVTRYMQKFDVDADGELNRQEFEDLVRDLLPPQEQDFGGLLLERRLKAMFMAMGKDSNKGLDIVEIREGLAAQGLEITDAQLYSIFATADINGDGKLDFREFSTIYTRHKLCHDMSAHEKELVAQRWEQPEELVKDGDKACKPGTKVMIRQSLSNKRGFQRLRGIGVLVRPETILGGRWYVKFPSAPEVFLSTGRRGIYEIQYVRDDPASASIHDGGEAAAAAESSFPSKQQPQSSLLTIGVGDNYENITSVANYEASMQDFRFRLILARLSADHTVSDPRDSKADRQWGKPASPVSRDRQVPPVRY